MCNYLVHGANKLCKVLQWFVPLLGLGLDFETCMEFGSGSGLGFT